MRALGIRPAIRAASIAAFVACAALATGCTNLRDDNASANAVPLPEGMPLCTDEFQPNKTIEEADFGRACRSAADELVVPRYVRLECADQTTLVWNDYAWGYVGQPMHLFDPNSNVRIPTDEALSCRANAGAALANGGDPTTTAGSSDSGSGGSGTNDSGGGDSGG